MNTTASSLPDHTWSRRCSIESVYSIQGQETDIVRDTSDTEAAAASDVEYEPATSSESDDPPVYYDTSTGVSDNDIITTKVVAVCVRDDGDLEFADAEQTDSDECDSEIDLNDYWQCAQCRADNNNPLYRYCEKCFKVRKNLFPPRPKRKRKRNPALSQTIPRTLSQDSGVESQGFSQNDKDSGATTCESQEFDQHDKDSGPTTCKSQEFSQIDKDLGIALLCESQEPSQNDKDSFSTLPYGVIDRIGSQELSQNETDPQSSQSGANNQDLSYPSTSKFISESNLSKQVIRRSYLKRRAESADRDGKRSKIDHSEIDSDSDSAHSDVMPLVKTTSDPSITIDESIKVTKKRVSDSLKEKLGNDNMCIICFSEPKSGVFVHGTVAHICCCYRCALKVWSKARRCPVCNCKVSNVLKAIVM